MYLKTLHLRHFRNYQEQQIDFSAPKTILVGDNAQGKSNLLEAVELLSTLRSHRALRDRELVQEGETVGQITAVLERDTGPIDLALTLRSNGRRTVVLNGESLRRHLDFLGVLNAVQFSSLDLELVRGGPERRRSWLDGLLTQLEPIYASILQQYNQVLRQRNAFLKEQLKTRELGGRRTEEQPQGDRLSLADPTQLAAWDTQLVTIGSRMIRRRTRVLERITPFAQAWHQEISGSKEVLEIRYAPSVSGSPLSGDPPLNAGPREGGEHPIMVPEVTQPNDLAIVQQAFWDKIQQRAIAEQYQGTTLVGPHRDEVEFTINGTPARQYGSQGQQRTLVLALKLAELKLIEEVIGESPLLLLDDVLAELDLSRQNQLLDAIQDRFQTLITTTHLGSFDAQWLNSSQILTVEAGKILSYSSF
ncbi:MAG: DNA replication/repair protein RecF [Leptolyngbyaceae bacterium]|nr:DNA replication/repair protein RecF [Leptolyngbyaceae bacterium]